MHKETPKWLSLFIAAFGAPGLVALAWWAGAFHAQRIRELQATYPILQISGPTGVGKSTLVANLFKLAGSSDEEIRSPSTCSFGALLAFLASAVNRPVVLAESGRGEDSFDWSVLQECYAGGAIARRVGEHTLEGPIFRGALAFVGCEDEVLSNRIVNIHLVREPRTEAHVEAIQALYELQIDDFAEFLKAVQGNREQVAYRLGHVGAYIDSLQEVAGYGLNSHSARNHAQLRALLDLLADLFAIPDDDQQRAHRLVCGMAWSHVPLKADSA